MPYEFGWLVPNRVMQVKMLGGVTLEDLDGVDRETRIAVASGQSPVHCIVNMLDVTAMPNNLKVITRQFRQTPHTNAGITIIVHKNPLYSFFGAVIGQLNGVATHSAPSDEAAVEKLQRFDPTLVTAAP